MLYLELSQNKKRELRVFFCKEIFGGKREVGGAWKFSTDSVQCSANHASWHGVAVSYMSTFLETRDWELVTCHHSDSEWYGEGSVGSVTAGGFLIFLLLVFFFFSFLILDCPLFTLRFSWFTISCSQISHNYEEYFYLMNYKSLC